VELISVGNELLIGKTLDTNAHWLAKRITVLGLKVRRMTTVGDDLDEISSALKEALERKPRFIILTGGLGPTFDDKTIEGIAKALDSPLKINEEARRMIEEKYEQYIREGKIREYELTPYRIKMAKMPEIAEPIPNPVGTAPGVKITLNETTIIALPGVPEEMKAIFDEYIADLIRKAAGDVTFFEAAMLSTGIVESEVAPIIDEVMKNNPYVYIKSHPKAAEKVPKIEIHVYTTAEKVDVAKSRLSNVVIQLSELIESKGGKTTPIKRSD